MTHPIKPIADVIAHPSEREQAQRELARIAGEEYEEPCATHSGERSVMNYEAEEALRVHTGVTFGKRGTV
jgi:hypothetical protein